MLLEKREELLKVLEERSKLNARVNELERIFIDEIFNKAWKWGGQERHVQYINYTKDEIQLGKSKTRPWDNDDYTVKTFTLEEFIEHYNLDKNSI